MALYENTFISRSELSPKDVEKLADDFAAILEKGKCKIVKREYWGLRTLAYPINKSNRGHFTFFGIDGAPEAVKEMERKMRINDDVIRLMTIRVDEISKEPSAPLRADEGDDREGRENFRESRDRDNRDNRESRDN